MRRVLGLRLAAIARPIASFASSVSAAATGSANSSRAGTAAAANSASGKMASPAAGGGIRSVMRALLQVTDGVLARAISGKARRAVGSIIARCGRPRQRPETGGAQHPARAHRPRPPRGARLHRLPADRPRRRGEPPRPRGAWSCACARPASSRSAGSRTSTGRPPSGSTAGSSTTPARCSFSTAANTSCLWGRVDHSTEKDVPRLPRPRVADLRRPRDTPALNEGRDSSPATPARSASALASSGVVRGSADVAASLLPTADPLRAR